MTRRTVKKALNGIYEILGEMSLTKLRGEAYTLPETEALVDRLEKIATDLDGKLGRRCTEGRNGPHHLEILRVEALWMATRIKFQLHAGYWDRL